LTIDMLLRPDLRCRTPASTRAAGCFALQQKTYGICFGQRNLGNFVQNGRMDNQWGISKGDVSTG